MKNMVPQWPKVDAAKSKSSIDNLVNGWKAIGIRGRRALLHAPRTWVEDVESRLIALLSDRILDGEDNLMEIVLPIEDAFLRLVAHALAEFYSGFGLWSFSRSGQNGLREVVVRRTSINDGMREKQVSGILRCTDILDILTYGAAPVHKQQESSLRDMLEMSYGGQMSGLFVSA